MKKKAARNRFVTVGTTVDRKVAARRLAERIVGSRLAACAQFFAIRSVYRWKGKVESANEYLLLAKTRASLASRLVRFIRRHHAYEVPEIVVTPLHGGWQDYLDWIAAETRGGKD